MLVLSRKVLQSIRIGKDVRLTVVKVGRGHVRLAIEAPRHVGILREELARNPDRPRGWCVPPRPCVAAAPG